MIKFRSRNGILNPLPPVVEVFTNTPILGSWESLRKNSSSSTSTNSKIKCFKSLQFSIVKLREPHSRKENNDGNVEYYNLCEFKIVQRKKDLCEILVPCTKKTRPQHAIIWIILALQRLKRVLNDLKKTNHWMLSLRVYLESGEMYQTKPTNST